MDAVFIGMALVFLGYQLGMLKTKKRYQEFMSYLHRKQVIDLNKIIRFVHNDKTR